MADPRQLARQIALENDLDPDIFTKLIQQESAWNPRAKSSAGALGLTQLMPTTAQGLGVRDPYDPEQNLRGGARFLKQMLDRYDGDYRLALAAYNAGPGAVDKYGDVPPFEETQAYIRVILGDSGGGKVLAKPAEQSGGSVAETAQQLLRRLVDKKGDPISVISQDPEVDEVVGGQKTGARTSNEAPTYRYLFNDDTHVDVKTIRTSGGERHEVVGGNALASAAKEDAPDKPIFAEGEDGRTYRIDPVTNTATPVQGMPGKAPPKTAPLLREGPDGRDYIIDPDTATGKPIAGMPGKAPAPPKMHTVGRSILRENADGTLTKVHQEPQDPAQRAPRYPEEIEGDRLDNELKRQKLAGAAASAYQGDLALIAQVEKMKPGTPGAISVEDASRYIESSRQNFEATLRGSTVADEQERMRADRRSRNSLGASMLNQRLSSGASLAASLTSSAFGSDAMMPAGKSSLGYSPGLLALEMTNYLQGGEGVADHARGQLQAGNEDWQGIGP